MADENHNEDAPLTEAEILSEGLLLEESAPKVILPKKGKVFEEDGTCKIAIIRPCVSRGKRLRGLPPIYTPAMLAENAGVFNGWLMYMDHLTEKIVELLQERGRSIKELGGRVTKSWYDPELVMKEVDEEYGYRPGAVVARALPQPLVRGMVEADPEILHVSINAYPKAVRPGVAPWQPSLRGMLVEGIRNKPPGTVDWVPRGGAGGRVLQEHEEQILEALTHSLDQGPSGLAVSVPRLPYDPARGRTEDMPDWKTMTREQLSEELRRENPTLAKALGLAEAAPSPASAPTPTTAETTGGLTEADLETALAERDASWEARLRESAESVEERAEELLAERDEHRRLEKIAHGIIKRSGLPSGWQADMLRRYSVLPSGPGAGLQVQEGVDAENKPLSKEAVLREAVKADLEHAADLIAESTGRRPRIVGLGGSQTPAKDQKPTNTAFRDFLRESGDKLDGDGALDIKTMVREGVTD